MYQEIEYAGGPNATFFERRNVRIPNDIREKVERRNAERELRNRRTPVTVPAVPELNEAERAELVARTNAVLGL